MPNPNVAQGTLNRLRGSVVVPSNTSLNVTASYLGPNGISMSFEGETTTMLPQMTGVVTSPQPYQMVHIEIHLLKTQSFAQTWENQRQTNSLIGDVTVTTDAATLDAYVVQNCAISNVRQLSFNGQDAGYVVTLAGYIQINSDLWNF